MKTEKTRLQARSILRFGRKMRDHLLRVHINACAHSSGEFNDEISPSQVHMLMAIKQFGECTISELAALLDVSAPSVSAMVDRLVEKEALIRERSARDRRVVVVRLSEAANEHINLMETGIEERFMEIIEKVGPELAEQWCDVVDQVLLALKGDV